MSLAVLIVAGMAARFRARRLNIGILQLWRICALPLFALSLLSIPARGEDSLSCGNGVQLRLTSSKPSQGGLALVEVRSPSALVDLKSDWLGQPLQFWQEDGDGKVRRALLGVDLERPAGQNDLTLSAQIATGEQVSCNALVSVEAGKFAIERLRVRHQFVELIPKDLERAEREQQRLKELFARVTPERLWQGSFRLPVDGVRAAKNFGRQRILNGQPRPPHSGEDFPAATGAPVHASQRGRVVLAEELFFSGNTVVLDHGLGLYTFYGHLESIAVTVGDVVETGKLLGRVGATGRATGPHLHWGVHLDGARVSPLELVALLSDYGNGKSKEAAK